MSRLCIKSDYTDYYDKLSNSNAVITYNRYESTCKQRGTALKYLRSLGINTIEVKQVNQFLRLEGPIVVYTDTKKHHSNGKKIMTVDEAMLTYENYTASKFYKSTDGITLKYLQIGKRRFALYFQKSEPFSLELGKLISIKELDSDYNKIIRLPIYSIDYISNNGITIATDFNEVENLQRIGINHYLTEQEIMNEIEESLVFYNNIKRKG